MDELKAAYKKVIIKHHHAVQTDAALQYTDNDKLEKKAKQFWADFNAANKEFEALLEQFIDQPVAWSFELASCKMPDGTYDVWGEYLTKEKPNVPRASIRNLMPLYARRVD